MNISLRSYAILSLLIISSATYQLFGSAGTITKSEIATSVYGSAASSNIRSCLISGQYYAIVYSPASLAGGILQTVQITDNGSTISTVDSWTFESGTCVNADIIPTGNDFYAIVSKIGNSGQVFSCSISTVGIITKSKKDSTIIHGTQGDLYNPVIKKVGGTSYYLMAYPWVKTPSAFVCTQYIQSIQINATTGDVGSVIDSITISNGAGQVVANASISIAQVNLSNNMWAAIHSTAAGTGEMLTFTCDSTNGDLSASLASVTTTLIDAGADMYQGNIYPSYMTGTNIIATWRTSTSHLNIQAVSINLSSGAITLLNSKTIVTDCTTITSASIAKTGRFVLGYESNPANNPAIIKTFLTDALGAIKEVDTWTWGNNNLGNGAYRGCIQDIGGAMNSTKAFIAPKSTNTKGTITTLAVASTMDSSWNFTISNSGVKDSYLNEANHTLDAHTDAGLFIRDNQGANTLRKAWYGWSALSDSLALSAYSGAIDSLVLMGFYTKINVNFGAGDTASLVSHATKRVGTELINWNTYDGTNNWQTAGAIGTNDTYGSYKDSLTITSITAAYPAGLYIYIRLDTLTAAVAGENWIISQSIWHSGTDASCKLFSSDNATGKPGLEVYGHTVTIPVITTKGTMFLHGKSSKWVYQNRR